MDIPLRRAGASGLDLPLVGLGLWQNFGSADPFATQRAIILGAVDRGITHLDLANNYGPPPGAAEETVGRLLRTDLRPLRDQLVITTKAGYRQWPGPYGEFGSRKYLLASLDQSLARLGLDHVDIFYSHRFDPTTPLTETIGALATAVASGRARYAGISSYSALRTREAVSVAHGLGLRLAVHQPSYSMLNRWIERPTADGESLLDVAARARLGVVAFSPLAQGMLAGRYLGGIPDGSRASRSGALRSYLTEEALTHLRALAGIAADRGQTLAQLALCWTWRDPRVTSVLLGASSLAQLDENLAALTAPPLTAAELAAVDEHAVDTGINLWASRSSDL
ncbi:MAG TPA: aldo/keto reductase [Actinotalea sp.]|nr:aldo/keto reductase [Actinotalea sp.]